MRIIVLIIIQTLIFCEEIVLINKKEITKINDCKNNQLFGFFNDDYFVDLLKDTLNDYPSELGPNRCSDSTTISCCSSSSIDLLYKRFLSVDVQNKIKNYQNNLKQFELIIREHQRNFMALNLTIELVENIFRDYLNKIYEIKKLSETLSKVSLKQLWYSYCYYVCDPNPNYSIYLSEYNYANITITSLSFDFYQRNSLLDLLNNNIQTFQNKLKQFNSELDLIYHNLNQTLLNQGIDNIYAFNSLSDGHYVVSNINIDPLCSNHNISCVQLLEKVCIPFFCFDDVFSNFTSTDVTYYNDILKRNYFSVNSIKATNEIIVIPEEMLNEINSISFQNSSTNKISIVYSLILILIVILI